MQSSDDPPNAQKNAIEQAKERPTGQKNARVSKKNSKKPPKN
jgi:hypothetical protein